MTSSTTASGCDSRTSASPLSPSGAALTSCPALRSLVVTKVTMSASSSTTTIRAIGCPLDEFGQTGDQHLSLVRSGEEGRGTSLDEVGSGIGHSSGDDDDRNIPGAGIVTQLRQHFA